MLRALTLLIVIFVIAGTPVIAYHYPKIVSAKISFSYINNIIDEMSRNLSQLLLIRDSKNFMPEIEQILSEPVRTVLSGNVGVMTKIIGEQVPLISEVLTNTQKEELYLKAPLSLELPALRVESYSQKIVSQLDPFEVSDTRKNGSDWELRISVDELTNGKSRIEREGIALQVRSNAIEMLEGSREGLEITEGSTLIIKPKTGKTRVKFLVRPEITVVIPKGIYSGHYTGKLSSTLE